MMAASDEGAVMAWSYRVERRIGVSFLVQQYFGTLPQAVIYFDGQVETGHKFPNSQVEMYECDRHNEPVRLLRRWTTEDGSTVDEV
ncbi:hypothetical protein [Streptacidiphilus carbonis]|uniref:hypothetical protein n=1 Tax=Streptacidiphilus carbonis TaxID=105422 RepID=UPI001269FFEA|nr:hypothetical protein [Streptacidiphilus carbonis]